MRKLKKGVYYNSASDEIIIIHDILQVGETQFNSVLWVVKAQFYDTPILPDIFCEYPLESENAIYLGEL